MKLIFLSLGLASLIAACFRFRKIAEFKLKRLKMYSEFLLRRVSSLFMNSAETVKILGSWLAS